MAAIVAVNAAGDIVDPATGRVVAGALAADGQTFLDARVILRKGGKVETSRGRRRTRRSAWSPPTRS